MRTTLILTALLLLTACAGMSSKDTASHERITTRPGVVQGQPGGPFVGVPGVRGAI